ncbi:MAG: VWA domain-containing protein [Planctomycetota bacterium]
MADAAFRFAYPELLLLLALPLLLWWWRPRRAGAGFAPTALAAAALRPSGGPAVHRLLVVAGIVLLTLAAARPQYGRTVTIRTHEGREIMLVVDLSGSMRIDDMTDAEGRRADRLAAVMAAAATFIDGRPADRIGLVIFAGNALSSCPITYDHETLKDFLVRIEAQQRQLWNSDTNLVGDGTNIGLGLGHALRGLTAEERPESGRAILVITDGRDTPRLHNWVDPIEAAERAAERDIRIHAIGVGDPQGSMTLTDRYGRVHERRLRQEQLPDLSRLRHIAETSGGIALAAGDRQELARVFAQTGDRFRWPLLLGLLLITGATLAEPRLRGAL